MRIGMIAPITHSYPPAGYGPWERVAHDLTEALVEAGHDVTLFAPAGSETRARLVPTVAHPLETGDLDPRLTEEEHIATAIEVAVDEQFDLVHSHLHVHALLYSRLVPFPMVTTLHGVAWNAATHRLLRRYSDQPFVSLSDAERRFLPELRYVATIGNGIRLTEFPMGAGSGGYLAFVGRIAPEKAVDEAITVAERSGRHLRIAGVIEPQHLGYFKERVEPRLQPGAIDYLGTLARPEVAQLVGGATGLVMPLRWDEPFGLVVVESLAVGTPVIAWRRGAMPEIVRDGATGFLVSSVDEAVDAVRRLGAVERSACRSDAEQRFSAATMAAAYADVYRSLTPSHPAGRRAERSQT